MRFGIEVRCDVPWGRRPKRLLLSLVSLLREGLDRQQLPLKVVIVVVCIRTEVVGGSERLELVTG